MKGANFKDEKFKFKEKRGFCAFFVLFCFVLFCCYYFEGWVDIDIDNDTKYSI